MIFRITYTVSIRSGKLNLNLYNKKKDTNGKVYCTYLRVPVTMAIAMVNAEADILPFGWVTKQVLLQSQPFRV